MARGDEVIWIRSEAEYFCKEELDWQHRPDPVQQIALNAQDGLTQLIAPIVPDDRPPCGARWGYASMVPVPCLRHCKLDAAYAAIDPDRTVPSEGK
jgi:hypothetical protein